jgi:excisionase family DNA binding protein
MWKLVVYLELLNLDEVALKLGKSTETVRRYVRAGKIKAVRIGNTWKVSQEHFDEFIKNNMNVKEDDTN